MHQQTDTKTFFLLYPNFSFYSRLDSIPCTARHPISACLIGLHLRRHARSTKEIRLGQWKVSFMLRKITFSTRTNQQRIIHVCAPYRHINEPQKGDCWKGQKLWPFLSYPSSVRIISFCFLCVYYIGCGGRIMYFTIHLQLLIISPLPIHMYIYTRVYLYVLFRVFSFSTCVKVFFFPSTLYYFSHSVISGTFLFLFCDYRICLFAMYLCVCTGLSLVNFTYERKITVFG